MLSSHLSHFYGLGDQAYGGLGPVPGGQGGQRDDIANKCNTECYMVGKRVKTYPFWFCDSLSSFSFSDGLVSDHVYCVGAV